MINLAIPLANWGMGTFLIIIFALVCIVLTIIVLAFIFGGKKKENEDKPFPEKENHSE